MIQLPFERHKTLSVVYNYSFQNRIHVLLPYAVFGLSSLIAGSLCTILPETKGVPTAELPHDELQGSQENTKEPKLDEAMI